MVTMVLGYMLGYHITMLYDTIIVSWSEAAHQRDDKNTVHQVGRPGNEAEHVDAGERVVLEELGLSKVGEVERRPDRVHQHRGGGEVENTAGQGEQNFLETINVTGLTLIKKETENQNILKDFLLQMLNQPQQKYLWPFLVFGKKYSPK